MKEFVSQLPQRLSCLRVHRRGALRLATSLKSSGESKQQGSSSVRGLFRVQGSMCQQCVLVRNSATMCHYLWSPSKPVGHIGSIFWRFSHVSHVICASAAAVLHNSTTCPQTISCQANVSDKGKHDHHETQQSCDIPELQPSAKQYVDDWRDIWDISFQHYCDYEFFLQAASSTVFCSCFGCWSDPLGQCEAMHIEKWYPNVFAHPGTKHTSEDIYNIAGMIVNGFNGIIIFLNHLKMSHHHQSVPFWEVASARPATLAHWMPRQEDPNTLVPSTISFESCEHLYIVFFWWFHSDFLILNGTTLPVMILR